MIIFDYLIIYTVNEAKSLDTNSERIENQLRYVLLNFITL